MSKMGNWVIEMQEDAYHMTLSAFCERYGFSQAEVWYETHFGDERDGDSQFAHEQTYVEMDDGA